MKQKITTDKAPLPISAYSQGIRVGNLIFLSGIIPLEAQTMTLISEDFTQQAQQVFKNLQAVTEAAGGNLDKIVKLTIYLTDLSQFSIVNEIMPKLFKEPYPARTTIGVAGLPLKAQIEIEAIMAA